MHLADAIGYDEEGVSLGKGELPLSEVKRIIDTSDSKFGVVIETWQGTWMEVLVLEMI